MSISEKYYYGNINPSEKYIRSGSEYQKLNKELCAHKVTRVIRTCLKAAYFGAFHSFFFDRREHIGRKEEVKIPRNLHAFRSKILRRADFSVKQGKNGAYTVCMREYFNDG